jgi:hypothetical protein
MPLDLLSHPQKENNRLINYQIRFFASEDKARTQRLVVCLKDSQPDNNSNDKQGNNLRADTGSGACDCACE